MTNPTKGQRGREACKMKKENVAEIAYPVLHVGLP